MATKDKGAWSIPKGLIDPEEYHLAAAKREFKEETGFDVDGALPELGTFRQPSGKRLSVWAVEGDCEPGRLVSNEFTMEWPPKSGAVCSFPEADRGEWFDLTEAAKRILKGQRAILAGLRSWRTKWIPCRKMHRFGTYYPLCISSRSFRAEFLKLPRNDRWSIP